MTVSVPSWSQRGAQSFTCGWEVITNSLSSAIVGDLIFKSACRLEEIDIPGRWVCKDCNGLEEESDELHRIKIAYL